MLHMSSRSRCTCLPCGFDKGWCDDRAPIFSLVYRERVIAPESTSISPVEALLANSEGCTALLVMILQPDKSLLLRSDLCSAGEERDGGMFFSVQLPLSTISKSGVLQSMSGTKGEVSLPSQMSDQDFLLWQTTPDDIPPCTSAKDIARLVQVADALADSRMQDWAHLLGRNVAKWFSRSVSLVRPVVKAQQDALSEALHSLPMAARTVVLQHALLDSAGAGVFLGFPNVSVRMQLQP
eukprot:jgi/Ulvmu1/11409/UM075_0071.1